MVEFIASRMNLKDIDNKPSEKHIKYKKKYVNRNWELLFTPQLCLWQWIPQNKLYVVSAYPWWVNKHNNLFSGY